MTRQTLYRERPHTLQPYGLADEELAGLCSTGPPGMSGGSGEPGRARREVWLDIGLYWECL